jgi:hypothetical protein
MPIFEKNMRPLITSSVFEPSLTIKAVEIENRSLKGLIPVNGEELPASK